jgi:plastocyanin
LKQSRRGVSSLLALLVVVVIIAAAFYVEIPMVASSSTTSSVSSTSSTPSTTATSSGAGSTGTLSFKIAQPLIVAPGQDESVSVAFSALGNISGNYTLAATGLPSGVNATFQPSSIDFPAGLTSSVTMTLSAASGAAVVNSTANVQVSAGSSVFTQSVPIMSVQALVLIQGNAFKPSSLSVVAGTKVYWLDLDSAVGGEVGVGGGHDVTAADGSFSSGTGNLVQYSIYGHTFATAGTVQYKSAAQPSMTAQIVVTS